MPESTHDVGSQWAIYESSVQSYRSLSLSSQSLFLAVGSILLSSAMQVPFYAVFLLAMVSTWYIWFPAIFARTAIVDYHKFELAQQFDEDGRRYTLSLKNPGTEYLREKEYAKTTNLALRRRVYAALTLSDNVPFRTMRLTRMKIDLFLPLFLTAVWVIFAIYVFFVT